MVNSLLCSAMPEVALTGCGIYSCSSGWHDLFAVQSSSFIMDLLWDAMGVVTGVCTE